jgi:chemotaxis protein methyltransferase CheR
VVCADLDAAQGWSARLAGSGLSSAADTDLDRVLERLPEVVVVDPSGWEVACRHRLEALADRAEPPPAVLFLAPEPEVQLHAGPALVCLPAAAALRDVTTAISRAHRAREAFVPYWAAVRAAIPPADETRIKALLRRHTGIEIRADRQAAFEAALRTRMVARLTPRPRDYAELLERSRGEYAEVELFSHLLLIGETYFWRYAGQFRALQETLVPPLIRNPVGGERVFRVWSAGCSTGEEAYSLAIACRQVLPPSWQVEVHGTDLDRTALALARRGAYRGRALRNLPPEVRRAYLEEHERGARVRGPVRQTVRFHHLNLASPAADSWGAAHGPFHAVFCRNVLIYFSRAEVERAVDRFEAALVPGGGLFLGASEAIYPPRPGLETVRGNGNFFFRKKPVGAVSAAEPPPAAPEERAEPENDRAGALYARGLARLDAEEFSGAQEAFDEILRQRADDARGHTGLALVLASQGREGEAAEHLARAARCWPDLAEAEYLQALMAERAGRDGEALQRYAAVLEGDPGFFMAHVNRGWILDRMGLRQRSRAEMRAALDILATQPPVARWLTGGIGREALVDLVHQSLAERGDRR